MATARYAWGIDIGNRALKAIRLTRVGAGVKIDDYDVIEHEQILSNAGDNRESLITSSLNAFVQKHNLKNSVVSVGVSGQSSFARFIKLPPVERKQIPNIVRFEAIQQIPFPLEDVEWSYQLFETPESPDVEVGIFAMRKELVARHMQYFTDLDMRVETVQMNPLAVYNAMQFDGRLKDTTMIIDMGAESTDLIIADNDSLWIRPIPIGGNSFTEALVKAFKLNFQKAEELKRQAGTSKYTRQIFQAMRPIFGDLVGEIQRSMGFFASQRREARIKHIIALGGTFRLPNLLRYLQQNLQLDAERVDSFRAGAPSDAKLAAGFNENMLSLAGAYGLALQAMGEGKVQSSLLPATIRRERMWREKTKWFAAAAALFAAGTGIAYGSIYLSKAAGGSEEMKSRNERISSQASALSSAWQQVESGGTSDRDTINKMFALTDYRMFWSNLLIDLRGALPKVQDQVAKGMAEWNADLVKQIPRDQRRLVVVHELSSRWVGDMSLMLKDPDFRKYASASAAPTNPMMGPGGPMGMGMGGMPMGFPGAAAPVDTGGGSGAKGFLITARLTTPYGDAPRLIQEELVANLLKIQRANDPDRKYLVAKAAVVTASRLANNQARMMEIMQTHNLLRGKGDLAKMRAAYTPGSAGAGFSGSNSFGPPPGFGGPPPGFGAPPPGFGIPRNIPTGPGGMPGGFNPFNPGGVNATQGEAVKYLDPLTEEEIQNDWEFVVLFAVAVDPPADLIPAPPEPAPAPTGEAAPTGGAAPTPAAPAAGGMQPTPTQPQ